MSEEKDKIYDGGMMGSGGSPEVEEPQLVPEGQDVETPKEPESAPGTPELETPELETPELETPEGPTPDPTPTDHNALAEELGIIRQFGSVENALRQIPEMNRYATQLQQERAAWRQQEQKPTEETSPVDGQDLLDDPAGTLRKMGIPTNVEVREMVTREAAQMMDNQRASDFIASKPDYDKRYPRMEAMFARMPELSRLPRAQTLEILYRLAEPRPVKQTVPAPGAEKTTRATTAGGRPSGRAAPEKIAQEIHSRLGE